MKKILLLGLIVFLNASCQKASTQPPDMSKVQDLIKSFEQQKVLYRLNEDFKRSL